jgi:hypothetical protein
VDGSAARAVAVPFGEEIPLDVHWSSDGLSATISLAAAVVPDASVPVLLLNVFDLHGNPLASSPIITLAFAPDESAPHVVASTPAAGTLDVYPAQYSYLPRPQGVPPGPPYGVSYRVVMKLTFNTPMDADTTGVTLQGEGEEPEPLEGAWDETARVLTVIAAHALSDETVYRLSFAALRSTSGEAVLLDDPAYSNAQLTFTTGMNDALLNHACQHVQLGPFKSVTAAALSSGDAPATDVGHNLYTITHPPSGAGSYLGYTKFTAEVPSYVLYMSKAEVLAMKSLAQVDAPWVELSVEPVPAACHHVPSIVTDGSGNQTLGPLMPAITHHAVLALPKGTTVSLRWGASGSPTSKVIVERVDL